MTNQEFHFIAGLPRSGSTLLSSIFNQNPAMWASITGPAAGIFTAMQATISNRNESASFLCDAERHILLKQCITGCHTTDKQIVWDTNRSWPTKINILAKLFPGSRFICCVRDIGWVVDSIEKLVRQNVYDLSAIFNFQPGMSVFDRAKALTEGGLVGSANVAMMEAAYGLEVDRMLLVEYDTLTMFPEQTMRSIYEWMGLTYYERHDFNAIAQIPGAAEFDKRMGTPGLHALGPTVRHIPRHTILPPDLFNSFGTPFWRTDVPKLKVIRYEVRKDDADG